MGAQTSIEWIPNIYELHSFQLIIRVWDTRLTRNKFNSISNKQNK